MKKLLLSLAVAMSAFCLNATPVTVDFKTAEGLPSAESETATTATINGVDFSFVNCKKGTYNEASYLQISGKKGTAYFEFKLSEPCENITLTSGASGSKNVIVQLTANGENIGTEVKLDDQNKDFSWTIPAANQAAGTVYRFATVGTKYNAQFTKMVLNGDGQVTPPVDEPTDVANIAAFLELAKDTKVKFTSPVTVVWQHQSNLYIKDATGTALVYGKIEKTYTNGTVLTGIEGTVSEYNGVKQLNPAAASFTDGTPGTAVEPEILQVEEVATDNVNAYVKFIGVTIAEDNGRNFKMSDASGEIVLYQNWTDIQIPAGENMTVTGFIGLFKGNAQILAASVTSASGKEVVAAPTFSVSAGEVAEGTEVAIECATEGATIYYTLDGTNPTAASTVYSTPVVINEALTIKAIAVKDGMDDSAIASAAYTIKEPAVVTGNEAMFNFADPTTLEPAYKPEGTEQSYLVAEVPGVTFSNNGISVVTVDGSSTARLWKCGTQGHAVEYRVYNGATTTISAQEGLLIKSVEFTGAQLTAIQNNGVALDNATAATWTSAEGVKSVKFDCVTNGSYKRADIATVKVTFEKATEGVADIEFEENAPAEYYNLQGVRMNGELTPGLYIRRQGNKATKVIVK